MPCKVLPDGVAGISKLEGRDNGIQDNDHKEQIISGSPVRNVVKDLKRLYALFAQARPWRSLKELPSHNVNEGWEDRGAGIDGPVVAALVVGSNALQKPGEGANNLAKIIQRQTKGVVYPSQGECKHTNTNVAGGGRPFHWPLWRGGTTPSMMLAVVLPTGCCDKGKTLPSMMLAVVPPISCRGEGKTMALTPQRIWARVPSTQTSKSDAHDKHANACDEQACQQHQVHNFYWKLFQSQEGQYQQIGC